MPTTSEKCNDSENEILQLQNIHETYPTVTKQSLNNSIFDPSFLNYTSKFIEILLPPDTPVIIDTILKFQKGDSVPKIVYKWITAINVLLWKHLL